MASNNYSQGAQVEHERYGLGTVMSSNEERIVIKFDDHGEKTVRHRHGDAFPEEERPPTPGRKASHSHPQAQGGPGCGGPLEDSGLNARQKRLFEEARRKNPDLKMPAEAGKSTELTEDDLALLKQGVGGQEYPPSIAIAILSRLPGPGPNWFRGHLFRGKGLRLFTARRWHPGCLFPYLPSRGRISRPICALIPGSLTS